MPTLHTYDYAVIRVVPRVEREEFINVGVIVSCPGARHLEAAIEIDPERLRAFAPALDQDALQPWLDAIVAICRGDASAGPIAKLPARAAFISSPPSAARLYRCRARMSAALRTRRVWWNT